MNFDMTNGKRINMNRLTFYPILLLLAMTLLVGLGSTVAFAENIDPGNVSDQFAYGENVGWINLEPSFGPGVTVTNSAVTGFAWGENIGWINLSPSFGGVINDGAGNLSDFAWGENVGWINFDPTGGGVTIDPSTGKFSGYAWGENTGWINLDPAGGGVITSWPDAGVDSDGDGFNDLEEAIGGTDPEDDLSVPTSETALVDGDPDQPIRLVVPQGVVITDFQSVDPASLPALAVSFPFGLVSIDLVVPQAGNSVTVALTFPGPVVTSSVYYKYGPRSGIPIDWYVFPFGSNDGDATITLTLTDGGAGDHDLVADASIIDPGGPGIPAPTLISLSSFTATAGDGHVTLEWTTGAEIDNEGFNILRSESEEGPYTKINNTLIPAMAISPGGASYEFVDSTVKNGKTYFYKLEDIDIKGISTLHGPIEITVIEGEMSSLDISNETQSSTVASDGERSSFDSSSERDSFFGCGFIKPTGNMKPPGHGEMAGTLLVLSLPFLWLLIRRLWRYPRSVREKSGTLSLETQ